MRSTHFLLASVLFSTALASGIPFGHDDCEEEGTPKCPPGYTLQKRAENRFWCMKYFTGNYSFFDAEKYCRCQGGATLSGIENHNELRWVLKQAESSLEDIRIKNGGVWVGAYRRIDCHGDPKKFLKKPECSKLLQFQWTDRNTQKTDMWKRWMSGAPHNKEKGKQTENCVLLQVSLEDQGSANKNLTGTFKNVDCVHPGNSPFTQEGFICGRPPKGGSGSYSGGGSGEIYIIGEGKPGVKKH